MRFKKLITSVMAIAMIGVMAGCNKTVEENPKTDVADAKESILRIGVMGSTDAIPLVIAQDKGYFEKEGVNIDLQVFKAAKDRDAALQAGELDGVIADEVAISIYQNSGIDMKITGITNGIYTLVAGKDSGVNSISDLKGKIMGISERTMMDYLADYIVTENNMEVKDIQKISIPAMPARLEALRNNQIDAAILPAPLNDIAVADGAKEIAKIDNCDIMISSSAFLQDIITNNSEAVQGFYKAYNEAVEYMNKTDISEYEDIVISTVGYSEDARGNIVLPEFKLNYLPSEERVQSVFDWSFENKIIDKKLNAKDVITDVGVK